MKTLITLALFSGLTLMSSGPAGPSEALAGRAARVDELIDAHLQASGISSPPAADDETFVRRAYLDIVGRIPTNREAEAFFSSTEEGKRDALVSELLRSPGFASHSFNYWADILRIKSVLARRTSGEPFIHWMKETLEENKPYDEMTCELIDAGKDASGFINGIKWRGNVNASQTVDMQFAQNVSQVFLGLNMKCASCSATMTTPPPAWPIPRVTIALQTISN